jgi:hypothetical protein
VIPHEEIMMAIMDMRRSDLGIFLIVGKSETKSKQKTKKCMVDILKITIENNYSLLRASIGLIFAALYAGNMPKNRPIPTEKERARIR